MFAARVRASLKPLFNGIHISSISRNREIAEIPKRISHERFIHGEWNLNSFRLRRTFHSSSKFDDVGVKTHRAKLFSSLEEDVFSELGCVEKDGDHNTVVKLLTSMPVPPSQKTNGVTTKKTKKNKKKMKKHEDEASDSIFKPMLLTEKRELSWKTNGKSKAESHASSPAKNVTDSNILSSEPSKSSSSTREQISKAQNIVRPSTEAKNETSSKGSNRLSSVVVVRIGNISSETTVSEIHSMCLSIGPLEGLARVNEDTVEVLFRAKNLKQADSLLEKLNGSNVDHSQWTAEIVPESEEASSIDEVGMIVSSCFKDLEKQFMMGRVLVKDLEILLQSVMHLENHPMAREETKSLECSQEA